MSSIPLSDFVGMLIQRYTVLASIASILPKLDQYIYVACRVLLCGGLVSVEIMLTLI